MIYIYFFLYFTCLSSCNSWLGALSSFTLLCVCLLKVEQTINTLQLKNQLLMCWFFSMKQCVYRFISLSSLCTHVRERALN